MFLVSFFFSGLISLTSFIRGNSRLFLTTFIIFFLSLFAGTRGEYVGPDYLIYKDIFLEVLSNKTDAVYFLINEPAFYLIPAICSFIFGSYFINATFLVFAFLGVSTKVIALRKTRFFFLSVILYVSIAFYTQEMIAIRSGVACGIFLLAIPDLVNKKDKRYFFKVFLALFFHYSSLLFLVVWVVIRVKINIKGFYYLLFFSLIVAFFKIDVLRVLKIDLVIPKVRLYLDILEAEGGNAVNPFNYKIIFSLALIVIFACKFKLLEKYPCFVELFKIHLLSLSLFFLLSPSAMVFSLRTFDLLSIVQVLLFPMVVLVFKERIVGYVIIIAFVFINMLYLFQASHLFETYSSWLF